MCRKKVITLLRSQAQAEWCRSQLEGEFELIPLTMQALVPVLEYGDAVAVIAGFGDFDEITRLGLYSLVQERFHTRLIFLFTGKNPPVHLKSYYPKAKFISPCSAENRLSLLLSSHVSLDLARDMKSADQRFMETCEFLAQITKAASCSVPVLLLGESGAGKSWAADYIHQMSARKKSPLVHINMAEIHHEFLESTLFGTEKGAFTGAVERAGAFEQADHGTLFLDEIADLDISLQAKLLRVIETGNCRRVGGIRETRFDPRLIFATNADLSSLVREGKFRRDLFYRINMFTIEVPPLRDHKQDIPGLAVLFAAAYNKQISSTAVDKLCSYSWPGNIRELKNVITKAAVFASGAVITEDLIQF